jgi:hypothetical protein
MGRPRTGGACTCEGSVAGHPRLSAVSEGKTWVAGTSPAMTQPYAIALPGSRLRVDIEGVDAGPSPSMTWWVGTADYVAPASRLR